MVSWEVPSFASGDRQLSGLRIFFWNASSFHLSNIWSLDRITYSALHSGTSNFSCSLSFVCTFCFLLWKEPILNIIYFHYLFTFKSELSSSLSSFLYFLPSPTLPLLISRCRRLMIRRTCLALKVSTHFLSPFSVLNIF